MIFVEPLEGFNNLMFYCLNQYSNSNLVVVLKNSNLIHVQIILKMVYRELKYLEVSHKGKTRRLDESNIKLLCSFKSFLNSKGGIRSLFWQDKHSFNKYRLNNGLPPLEEKVIKPYKPHEVTPCEESINVSEVLLN